MEIPQTFKEVLDQRSVNPAFSFGRLKIIAEDAIDIHLVGFFPKKQEESVAVLADGGAEVHHSLIHVIVAGLHLGHLDGFTAGVHRDLLLSLLPFRQVQDLHDNLELGVLGRPLQHCPNPVSTQEDALLRSHDCAVKGILQVDLNTPSDVGHQEDLLKREIFQ